jgi:lysozyme
MTWLKSILLTIGLAGQPSIDAPPPTPTYAVKQCVDTCAVSDDGYEMVRNFEGYMPFPYKDVAGIETVGYGYVVRPGDKFTYPLLPPDADALLKKTMGNFQRDINKAVIVGLYQYQFDALASLTYNIGTASFKGSTVLKRVNAGRHSDVPDCFLMWNKATIDGVLKPVVGLTVRRQEEANHYAGK